MNLAARHSENVPLRRRGMRAFTMIEIAISIGIIGFALVAIIGILPRGLNVQKDNREDGIVNADANYFMQAIRNGAVITNGYVPGHGADFLAAYVDAIRITNTDGYFFYATNSHFNLQSNTIGPGAHVVGLLTTPSFYVGNVNTLYNGLGATNYVRAWVHSLSGAASTQGTNNSVLAFRYIMDVQITPYVTLPSSITQARLNELQYLSHNLYEARLTFHWPVLPDGGPGPNNQTFRSIISSSLTNLTLNGVNYYFFRPQTFTTNNYL